MTRVARTVLLACVLVVIALASAVPADQQQPPTFRTAVSLVRVDVYPTRDGRPVEDLTKEDFEILEDGASQVAATFERLTVRPAAFARIEPRDLRESNRMAADPHNRVFVLFVDTYHLPGMFQGVDPGPVLKTRPPVLGLWLQSTGVLTTHQRLLGATYCSRQITTMTIDNAIS